MSHNNEEKLIDPRDLEEIANSMPIKVNVRHYISAMRRLREKRYSFGDIATWMTEHLGVEITRSQVTYALNTPPEILAEDEEQEAMEDEAEANS